MRRMTSRGLSLLLLVTATLMLMIETIVFMFVGWQSLFPLLYARHPTVLTTWILGSCALAALAILILVVGRWMGSMFERTSRDLSLLFLVTATLMHAIELVVFAVVAWQVLYPRHPAVLATWTLGSGALAALASLIIVVARWRDAARRSWR